MEETPKVDVEQLQALLLGVSNYLPVILARIYIQHGECNFLFKSLLDLIVLLEVYFEVPGYANRIVKESADLMLSLANGEEKESSVTIEELEGGNRDGQLTVRTGTELEAAKEKLQLVELEYKISYLKQQAASFKAHADLDIQERKVKIEKLRGTTSLEKSVYSLFVSIITVLLFQYNTAVTGKVVVGGVSVILGTASVAVEIAGETVANAAFKVGAASYDATVGKAVNALDSLKTTVTDVASVVLVDAPTKLINYASSVASSLFGATVTSTAAIPDTTTTVLTNATEFTEIINNTTDFIQSRTFRDRLAFRSVDIQHVIHETFKELITNHISDQDKYVNTVGSILLLAFLIYALIWIVEKLVAKPVVASVLTKAPEPEVVTEQRRELQEIHNTYTQQNLIMEQPAAVPRRTRRQSAVPQITNGRSGRGGTRKRRGTYRKKRFSRKPA